MKDAKAGSTTTGTFVSDVTDLEFEDLFDLEEIQAIQDAFALATGVASLITHIDGTPITNPSNFCRLCEIIRQTDKGLKNCYQSDAVIGRFHPDGPIVQPCLSGGLWDGGASIHVGGKHIANWLIGQVRNDSLDLESMLEYARTIGAPEEDFRSALEEVTVMSLEQFRKVGQALFLTANLMSELAYKNAQQQIQRRSLEEIVREQSQELAASEKRYREIVENISDWVWEVDKNGRYIFASDKIHDMLGYSPEEILGKTPFDLMPPDEAERVAKEFSVIMEQEKPFSDLENTNLHKNGERVVVATSGVPQFDAKGRLKGFLGIDYDITLRRNNEEQLRRFAEAMMGREERILEVKHEVNDLCLELNRDPPYAEIHDRSPTNVNPQQITELFKPPDEAGLPNVRKLFDSAILQRTLDLCCGMTGVAAAILDLKGDIIARAQWQRICTEFHRVNKDTCQSCKECHRELDDRLVEATKPILGLCPNGLVYVATPIVINDTHVANALVGQFFLSAPDEARFRAQANLFGFVELDYMEAFNEVPVIREEKLPGIQDLVSGLAELSVAMVQQQLRNRRLTARLQTQGDVALSLLEDARLAEQRAEKATEETKKVNQELTASNQELQQFAYVASHDLQEPLRMVASYTQLLAERYRQKLDEKADKYIGYAVDGAQRMQGLINDLLAFSRVGTRANPFAPADCGKVLDEVIKNLEKAIEESSARVIVGDLPSVMGDRTQLSQLFQNLIANAIRFHGDAPPRVEVSALLKGSEWEFTVADNGIGIDPKFKDRIFVIFQRLHERGKYPGSGIGLSIVKKIVERHGGSIRVESSPGQGARFIFSLPVIEEQESLCAKEPDGDGK